MSNIPILRFRSDRHLREMFYVLPAMAFPAKAHLTMMQAIFDKYTQPGDWVLDPFGGIGGSLIGCVTGRNVLLVEKEAQWVKLAKASWEKMQTHGPMMGFSMGEAIICQGDSRRLSAWTGLGQDVDQIVTSPPYEGSISPGRDGVNWDKASDSDRSQNVSRATDGSSRYRGYTEPVAAIVTSPPYGQAQSDGGLSVSEHYKDPGPSSTWHTQGDQTNIGNLRGPAFWEACTQVLTECKRVLKPGGNFVIISKGFTRDKAYIDLPDQFQALMESLGFSLVDHWRRQLWTRSFWRTLQKNKDPESWDDRLDYEEVMCFRGNLPGGL